ncbi:MAG: Gfo/Idh/MocA family oxidoreductase [Trueperaceae bacterium]|nr:Gfo/Idh/MocA family oxidoreductase [Trueperaceae bacterium]
MNPLEAIRSRGHVRWGIVGCGDVTEVKSGPAFQRVAGSSLAAVMRRDGAKARDYAERHGVPRWSDDARDVIEADDVDAVYVATPPSGHATYVLQAAQAGKPVYVEKPMARTVAEAEAMVAACTDAGVPLFVAYYRRALPRFEFVRARLADGAIGTPTRVHAVVAQPPPADAASAGWRWDAATAGDGLLFDLGSHGLDLLDHWFGPVRTVAGHARTRSAWAQVSDEHVAALAFEGGVIGTAAWGFAGPTIRDRIEVFGTAGSLHVPLFADGPVVLTDAQGRTGEHRVPHPAHVQAPLIAAIVADLLGLGGPAPSTGASALRTQRVLERLATSR